MAADSSGMPAGAKPNAVQLSEPRGWTVEAKQFGVEPTLGWRDPIGEPRGESLREVVRLLRAGRSAWPNWVSGSLVDDLAALAAAQEQHRYAYAIRRAARAKFESVKNWCNLTGISYAHAGAALRGEVGLRVSYLARARLWMAPQFADALDIFDDRHKPGPDWLLDIV